MGDLVMWTTLGMFVTFVLRVFRLSGELAPDKLQTTYLQSKG